MRAALRQASVAKKAGNYPIGAVLVVNGRIIAKEHNKKENKADRISHAEMLLFLRHSKNIFKWNKHGKAKIELFTTFEPCLMCLGASVVHRIHRIVVACKDPRGDISTIKPEKIGVWYKRNWPAIEYGLFSRESLNLMLDFFKKRMDLESREAFDLLSDVARSKNG